MKLKNLNLSICQENGEVFFNVDIPEVVGRVKSPELEIAPPVSCPYNYGVTKAGDIGLNVQEKPEVDSAVVGALQSGQRFKIVAKVGDWYQISLPFQGYIDAQFTQVTADCTTISEALVNFTASYEGFSATAYQDPANDWTIGYGFNYYDDKPNFTMTEPQAKRELTRLLKGYASQVAPMVQGLNLCQAQFDALVDFAYNLGADALRNSDLLANIKECCCNSIITNDFLAWDHCGTEVLPGLKKRRTNESILFLTGKYINN